MKSSHPPTFAHTSTHLQPHYDVRSVKSLQNQPLHLNQNLNQNLASYLTIRPKKHHHKQKSKKSHCPILQPQQPQNYLNEFEVCKQVSLISCKSQPLNLTRCKKQSHGQTRIQFKKNSQISRDPQKNTHLYQNDNKKTRKHFTKHLIDYGQQANNNTSREYYFLGKCKKEEQTFRTVNKQKCPHKDKKKQQIKTLSLQNLNSRMSLCEAYIQLGERKTALLTQEVGFLLVKEHQRHNESLKKIIQRESRRHRHHHHHKVDTKEYRQNAENFDVNVNVNGQSKSHKHNKKVEDEYFRLSTTPSKFHFRSTDNKSSRMRELIYFHENGKQSMKHHKKCNKTSRNHHCSDKKEETSIYEKNYQKFKQNQDVKHKNKKGLKNGILLPQQKNEQILENHRSTTDHYNQHDHSHPSVNKQTYSTQNMNLNNNNKPSYSQQSEYLLQEYESNSPLHHAVHYNPNPNIVQNSHSVQFNAPYINSQQIQASHTHHHPQTHLKHSNQNDDDDVYLTNQFQISEDNGRFIRISPTKKLSYSRRCQQQQGRESSQVCDERSRKVGQFCYGQVEGRQGGIEDEEEERMQVKDNEYRSNKKPTKKSRQTSPRRQLQINQKQYTFISPSSPYKHPFPSSPPSAHFQVIDSNLTTPQHFPSNLQSNQNTETRIIRQFDELVLAAAEEHTPMRKKMIREKIYRTTREVREINERNLFSGGKTKQEGRLQSGRGGCVGKK